MTDKTIAELREWKKQYDIFPSMAADKEFIEILSHAVPVKANDDGGLGEAINLMTLARSHGGPVAYHDADDSVGYYVCCGNISYKDHDKDCWYMKICEFLDSHASSQEAK